MSDLSGALCVGKWWLFDSVDILDHIEARQVCAECPAIESCRGLLREASQIAYGGGKGGFLQGTWAGQLYGRQGARRPRLGRESVQVSGPNRTLERVGFDVRRGPDRLRGSDPLTTDSILETNGG